jgi:hypothetical protein
VAVGCEDDYFPVDGVDIKYINVNGSKTQLKLISV